MRSNDKFFNNLESWYKSVFICETRCRAVVSIIMNTNKSKNDNNLLLSNLITFYSNVIILFKTHLIMCVKMSDFTISSD